MSFQVSRLPDALDPPDPDLANRLGEFLRITRELLTSPLFKKPMLELEFTPRGDGTFDTELQAAVDYLQTKGTMTSFRQLWQDGEPYQFTVVRSRLRAHAVASNRPASAEFVEWADGIGKAYSTIRKQFPDDFIVLEAEVLDDGKVVEKGSVKPERIIDDWVNGAMFHSDPAKRARIDAAGDPEMYAFGLLVAVQEVTKVYVLLAQMANAMLREPALQPHS